MPAARLLDSSPDRRGALRFAVVVPALVSTAPGEAIGVTITDISESGCQLARSMEIQAGSVIVLSFGGFAPVEAAVIWTSAAAVGLHFDAPVHPALVAQVVSAGKGRRRARKLTSGLVRREEREKLWHLALPISFTLGADNGANPQLLVGELRDLSVEGCRIDTSVAVLPGTQISASLSGPEPVLGSVRWCEEGSIGVRFHEPLQPTLIERVAGHPLKDRADS